MGGELPVTKLQRRGLTLSRLSDRSLRPWVAWDGVVNYSTNQPSFIKSSATPLSSVAMPW